MEFQNKKKREKQREKARKGEALIFTRIACRYSIERDFVR